jgi:hypothetical protein
MTTHTVATPTGTMTAPTGTEIITTSITQMATIATGNDSRDHNCNQIQQGLENLVALVPSIDRNC